MSNFDPKIYRNIGLQKAKVKKLIDLDIFEDLADIDYLYNLDTKISHLASSLTEKGLIPEDFEKYLGNDHERVLYIKELFKIEPNRIGKLLEELQEVQNRLTENSDEVDEGKLRSLESYIEHLEKKIHSQILDATKFTLTKDWQSNGKLDNTLLEYHTISTDDSFYQNVNPLINSFTASPKTFEKKVLQQIENLRVLVKNLFDDFDSAKESVTYLQQLYDNGEVTKLKDELTKIEKFSGVGEELKHKMSIYDDLLNRKKFIESEILELKQYSEKTDDFFEKIDCKNVKPGTVMRFLKSYTCTSCNVSANEEVLFDSFKGGTILFKKPLGGKGHIWGEAKGTSFEFGRDFNSNLLKIKNQLEKLLHNSKELNIAINTSLDLIKYIQNSSEQLTQLEKKVLESKKLSSRIIKFFKS